MNVSDEKIKMHFLQKERTEDLLRNNKIIMSKSLSEVGIENGIEGDLNYYKTYSQKFRNNINNITSDK